MTGKKLLIPSWKILVKILNELTKDILLLIQWKTFEFS